VTETNVPTMEKILSVDGTPIACWRSGEGPPLLLVHGTAADHARWAPVLPALEEHFTVLTIDRRGRGESGDADQYVIEREFEDVACVVDWAGAGTGVLGHSYGGMCALEAALRTEKVQRLVLYEPSMGRAVPQPEVIDRLEALLEADEREELLTVFFGEVARVPRDQIDLMRALPAWEARLAAAHTIPRELRSDRQYAFAPKRFGELEVPTLLLQGGDSSDVFRKATEMTHAALSESRIVVMPGQRHTAMDTGTEMFTAEVLSFLNR
jgi:pimeloyl-ACP methyl ester carboxylesterase